MSKFGKNYATLVLVFVILFWRAEQRYNTRISENVCKPFRIRFGRCVDGLNRLFKTAVIISGLIE